MSVERMRPVWVAQPKRCEDRAGEHYVGLQTQEGFIMFRASAFCYLIDMTFSSLIVLGSAVWLLSCSASLLALYWNVGLQPKRLKGALISSCTAVLIGYFGISRIQLSASKTVNGDVVWSLNSKWFFIGALAAGGIALALTLWNWTKALPARSNEC